MDLQQAILNRSHYYKNLKQRLDAHNDKISSLNLRNKWLKTQKKANYQNEYDRIRSELDRTILPSYHSSIYKMQDKKKELEKLGAKMVDTILD